MEDQTPQPPSAEDRRDALKTRRAGQTSITLFAVFIITLLSFGRAPVAMQPGGGRMNLDLVSCLGVAMGMFAFLFVLTSHRRILRLTTARKVLGLVGSVGLILHTILALASPISCGAAPGQPAGLGGRQPLAVGGPEQWQIDGRTYDVSSTYYLPLPEGLQYTIEYPRDFTSADADMNDERALQIVFPLMRHAYASGLYKRAAITGLGPGAAEPMRIGVVLVQRNDGVARGYRVALSLDRIKERMAAATSSAATLPTSDPASP